MGKAAWMTGSLLGVAMLMSGGAVAQTQPRYDYPQAGGRQDQGDAYQDEDLTPPDQNDEAAAPRQSRPDEDFSDVVAADRQREQATRGTAPAEERDESATPRADDEEGDALTNDCAIAARNEAEREGGYAEVRQMEAPRENRNGFSIEGDVESRSSWRAQDGRTRHFTCTVVNGRVEDVYFRGDRAAR
ncbi:MAG TPA: hypothetical protein VJQ78_09025 [Sphingobium sp.]|nr:hypothetical protein [Sphingobium sp.]